MQRRSFLKLISGLAVMPGLAEGGAGGSTFSTFEKFRNTVLINSSQFFYIDELKSAFVRCSLADSLFSKEYLGRRHYFKLYESGQFVSVLSGGRIDRRLGSSLQKIVDGHRESGAQSVLNLHGMEFELHGPLVLDGVRLRNVSFILASVDARVVLKGSRPGLDDFVIKELGANHGPYTERGGCILLHQSTGAMIRSGVIWAGSRRAGVLCISSAVNTKIMSTRFYCAWGVLFDDMHNRYVERRDYGCNGMGHGLIISACDFFGDSSGNGFGGDAIEINAPVHGFRDLLVEDTVVHRAYTSKGVGMGLGVSSCTGVKVQRCYFGGTSTPAGAVHFEWCADVFVTGCTITKSLVGISIGMCRNVLVSSTEVFDTEDTCLQSFNVFGSGSLETTHPGIPSRGVVFDQVRFSPTRRKVAGRRVIALLSKCDIKFLNCTFFAPGKKPNKLIRGVRGVSPLDGRLSFESCVFNCLCDSLAEVHNFLLAQGFRIDRFAKSEVKYATSTTG
ncbi:hypothetical protein Q4485_16040 [Granulosicoccaceae sp. 1_MG-2023]|nr:hypothetical protein [Granulosicoccaceae sp. 1_MG-2023]